MIAGGFARPCVDNDASGVFVTGRLRAHVNGSRVMSGNVRM